MKAQFVLFALCLLATGAAADPAVNATSLQSPAPAASAVPGVAPNPTAGSGPEAVRTVPEEAMPDPNESTIDYFWRKSDVAFHDGDYPRAIGLHKAIVALDLTQVESFGVGAWLMWSIGHGDEAVAFIQRGVAANPNDWEMWNTAGQQYDLQKMTAAAQTAYSRAVALVPKTEDAELLRRCLAHAAERNGDLSTSLKTWRDLVRDYPDHAVDLHNEARVEQRPRRNRP